MVLTDWTHAHRLSPLGWVNTRSRKYSVYEDYHVHNVQCIRAYKIGMKHDIMRGSFQAGMSVSGELVSRPAHLAPLTPLPPLSPPLPSPSL